MNNFVEINNRIYNSARRHKCLCAMNSDVLLESKLSDLFCELNKATDQSQENLLLYATTLSAIGETYHREISSHGAVCSKMDELMRILLNDSVWKILFKLLISTKDKFCGWMLAKGLVTIIYCFPKPSFEKCIQDFLLMLKTRTIFSEGFQPILHLFTFILNYETQTKSELCNYDTERAEKCQNKKSSEVSPVSDISQCFCAELSHFWPDFMEEFKSTLNKQNSEYLVSDFLDFWKSLMDIIEKKKNEYLMAVYMNSQNIFDFFILVKQIPSICLHTYLNLIIQIFSSSVKYQPWKADEISTLEKTIADAFDHHFLHFIFTIKEISGFCQLEPVSNRGLDGRNNLVLKKESVILNKVIYITLCACAGMKKEESLCSVLLEVEAFLKKYLFILHNSSGYVWVLDKFFEQDDLLFGSMLALLRIYTFLKGSGCQSNESSLAANLLVNYNAHKVFIHFLRRIGHHHHTLLEFLMTSETCFLLYLTLYLKFLICDWENFIAVHDHLNQSSQHKNTSCSSEISVLHEPDKENSNTPSKSQCQSEIPSFSNYSDTQYWEEEENLKVDYFLSVIVLIKLRDSIKKLVQRDEFPYNVQYLMGLLDCCEEKHQSFLISAQ